MNEIAKRLHEQRRLADAKEILESAGYVVNKINENLKKMEFPTEQEAYDYAREHGMEVVKTQDCNDGCLAFLREYSYKPKQEREELPESRDLDEADVTVPDDAYVDPDPSKISLRRWAKNAVDKEEKDKAEAEAAARKSEMMKKAEPLLKKIKSSPDPLEAAFEELVPASGKAETVAGELVRAMMRILYRDYNDGDKFYEGYGLETCASSVAYLMDIVPELREGFSAIAEAAQDRAFSPNFDEEYTEGLQEVASVLLDYLYNNPELFYEENTEDSRNSNIDIREIEEWAPKYDLDVEIPWGLKKHIEAGNISTEDLLREMEWWDSLRDTDVSIEWGDYVLISNIDKEKYDYLSETLYDELQQYGYTLDEEYGDPEEQDEEEEE